MKLIKKRSAGVSERTTSGVTGNAVNRRTFLRRSGLGLGGAAVALTRISLEAAAVVLGVLLVASLVMALFLKRIDMSL